MSDSGGLLPELLAVRGVRAAALVGIDGEYLGGESSDPALLERMVGTVTSALAAGEALSGLLDDPEPKAGSEQLAGRPPSAEGGAGASAEDSPGAAAEAARAGEEPSGHGELTGAAEAGPGQHQLMVMYQDGGPILFTPLADGARLAVVALSSSHDIGRARFQLRGLVDSAG